MTHYLKGLAVALVSSAAFSTAASAQDAVVTADLHMRAGPSAQFPIVTTIVEDAEVQVFGCLGGYGWCDVAWRGNRGWVFGDYLNYYYENRYVPIVEYGTRIEVPIITFSFGSYWEDYYRDRPWYDRRDRWRAVWRGDRDDDGDRRRGDRGRGDWRDDDDRQAARGDDDRDEDRADRQDGESDDSEQRRRQARGDDRNADEGPEDTLEQGSVDDSDDGDAEDQPERRRRQVGGEDDRQQQIGSGGPNQGGNQDQERQERQARSQDGNAEDFGRRERQAGGGGSQEPQARSQEGSGDDEELLRRRRNEQ